MGGKPPKQEPPPPQKTVKEMVKEFGKSIRKMQREFLREINKLEMNNKKIQNELNRMIQKKEPRSAMRIVAQNVIRNNNYLQKYHRLDAQLSDMTFQLNSAATTETLVDVMKGMGDIMKKATGSMDIKNIQMVLETFNMEVEKQNIMQEQINDIMNSDVDEVSDADTDKIIADAEMRVNGGPGNGGQAEKIAAPAQPVKDDFANLEDRLNALK